MASTAASTACIIGGAALVAVAGLVACGGSGAGLRQPDDRFGHRYEGTAEDGRETLVLAPRDTTGRYIIGRAPHDTVHVRLQPTEDGTSGSSAELLVKGYLPDTCSELHEVLQSRQGSEVNVRLEMRRPEGALCAAVVRPYRFYVRLSDSFEPGSYTLNFNSRIQTFEVR